MSDCLRFEISRAYQSKVLYEQIMPSRLSTDGVYRYQQSRNLFKYLMVGRVRGKMGQLVASK